MTGVKIDRAKLRIQNLKRIFIKTPSFNLILQQNKAFILKSNQYYNKLVYLIFLVMYFLILTFVAVPKVTENLPLDLNTKIFDCTRPD